MNVEKIKGQHLIKIVVDIILFCVYIFPSGILNVDIPMDKLIFIASINIMYVITASSKFKIKEIIFLVIIFSLCIYTKTIDYMLFVPILFLDKIIQYKEDIKEHLEKSSILYICLIFTFIYTIYYFGKKDRYAYTAIGEINQSGLAIFCLAILLLYKNKNISIVVFILGFFTFSRSYYLSIILLILCRSLTIKKFIKFINVKRLNFFNLTIISSVILFFLGLFYIKQYNNGNIFWGDEVSTRLYTFLDYSNFFRFLAVYLTINIFIKNPQKLIIGLTDNEYVEFGSSIARSKNLPYKATPPHNLFFSHLKLYGVFAIVEIIYVSKVLKKIVNINNFGIYFAIALYSIILGAGLYSYWLYLSFFTLIINMGDDIKDEEKSIVS